MFCGSSKTKNSIVFQKKCNLFFNLQAPFLSKNICFFLTTGTRLKMNACCFWDVTYVKKNDASCPSIPGYADNFQSAKEKCNADPECEGFVNSNCGGSQFALCGTPLEINEHWNTKGVCVYIKKITRNYLESSWSMWHWKFLFCKFFFFFSMYDYIIFTFIRDKDSHARLLKTNQFILRPIVHLYCFFFGKSRTTSPSRARNSYLWSQWAQPGPGPELWIKVKF